jgi:hypothetical protein
VCQDGIANAAATSGPTVSVGVKFDQRSVKAAFNYKWTQAGPGAWAHNEFYVFQAIYDSIVDLGYTPNAEVHAVTSYATGLPTCSPLNRPATLGCP